MTSLHHHPPSATTATAATSSSSTSTSSPSSSSTAGASIPTAPLLHPPPLFAPVAPNIYRSAMPSPSSHPFLETLQLRTILSLTPELPSPSLQAFARKFHIRFIHLGAGIDTLPSASHLAPTLLPLDASPTSSTTLPVPAPVPPPLPFLPAPTSSPLTTEHLKDSLQLLLDARTHPLLVTDTSGIHETGILLASLRKLQRWNFATLLVEYRSFAGNRARAANERLVEMFDTDLITLPEGQDLPGWFREQVRWDEEEVDRGG